MSYCTKCGMLLNRNANFCPNCGTPTSPLYTKIHITKSPKNKHSSFIIYGIAFTIICFLLVVLLHSQVSNKDSEKFSYSFSNILKKEKSQEEIQSIKNINEMKDAIANTVWTCTKTGNLFWIKLEFKGDKVKVYNAMPSDGKWTFSEECPYTLEEGRFIDDGRKYIAAVIKTKDFSISPKFIITNGHISWLGLIDAGGFVLGDYEWD